MARVTTGTREDFESLLRRFNKKMQLDGVLSEVMHREYYEKPSVKRKCKEATRRRKSVKASR